MVEGRTKVKQELMGRVVVSLLLCVSLYILSSSCEKPQPIQIVNPYAGEPDTELFAEGLASGDTTHSSDVTFRWRGSEGTTRFAYSLDGAEWSEWTDETSHTLRGLDEGVHTFSVKGSFPTQPPKEELSPAEFSFVVDAVQGPALLARPRRSEVRAGDSFRVDLMAEEVEDLMVFYADLRFDPSLLAVTEIEPGPFWRKDDPGGTVISQFSGYDNAAGRIELNVALAGADPPGGNGSGVLAILHLRAKGAGTVNLTFGGDVRFRDSTGRDIPLNDAIEPEVVIH